MKTKSRVPGRHDARPLILRLLLITFIAIAVATITVGAAARFASLAQDSDLGVIKIGPDSAQADTNIAYTITVFNTGPDATSATMADALPPNTTFVSLAAPAGWLCSTPSPGGTGSVTCNNPGFGLSSGDVFTLIVHIDSGVAAGTFINNQASVTTQDFDANEENNTSAASTIVMGDSADLSLSKTASNDKFPADSDVTYTITVINPGPNAAANASWSDTLPGTLTFVSIASTPDWNCTTPGAGSGGTITCNNSSLAAGGGAQVFTLVAHVPADTQDGTEYTNQASVTSDTLDPNSENNSSTAGITTGCVLNPLVTSTDDSGAGTLREAITNACVGSTITFSSALTTGGPATITLTSAELLLTKNLTILGPGANLLAISGNNTSRVFEIQAGKTVTISGVSIKNGRATNGRSGAGIFNNGTLVLRSCDISGNTADDAGGGIANVGTSNGAANLTIINCAITGNQGTPAAGVLNKGNPGDANLTIINSTISGNTTSSFGGGLKNDGFSGVANANITNSTISGNTAATGGGIHNGGVGVGSGILNLNNSIVSDNTAQNAASGPDIFNTGHTIAGNHNIIETSTGYTMTGSNNLNVDPFLEKDGFGNPFFKNNGGPTNTILLLPTSPAINTGSNGQLPTDAYDLDGDTNTAETLPVDQRGLGFNRVIGGTVDRGAVEVNYAITATAGTPQLTSANTAFPTALKATVTESGIPVNNISVTFTAPGSGASGTFPGSSITAVVATNSSGVATAPTFTANAIGGSYNVVASLAPGSPTASFALTNNKLDQTINFGSISNTTYGDADFGVSPTATSNLAVSLAAMGNCTVTTPAPGTVHITGAGSCTITASQAGNATYNPASDVSQTFSIAKAATSTAVGSSVNPSNNGQNVTFTATVSSSAGTPTGSVQFKDGGSNLGSPQALDGSGVATFSTTSLSAGVHTITADYSGDTNFQTSTGTLAGGQQVGSIIRFSASSYNTTENSGFTTITVERIGDLSQPVTVDYATPDDSSAMTILPCSSAGGVASARCDFEAAFGTIQFAAGDGAAKAFKVLINQDSFVEGPETLTLTLSNLTGGAGFTTPGVTTSTATLSITDDVSEPAGNPIDDTDTFVRQQYRDFLNREPDAQGLAFWKDDIDKCNDPARRPPGLTVAQCIEVQRINTSAAFFLSIEFQNTGYFVERIYKAAFGDINPPTVPVPVRFNNFIADTQQIGNGVIVGQGNWDQQLNANKTAYTQSFVQRTAFLNRYPPMTSASAFVDALDNNAGNVLSPSERNALIVELSTNAADPVLRASVLKKVAENATLQQRESNRAFVLMQYFGYLRRNPDAAPEPTLNFAGYNFWLAKLNQANGDFMQAEMVKAFLSSIEYRNRFGP